MSIISKNILEEVRNANDVVEVVGAHIQLKRAGSNYRALCPFHKEKTPSFNVNAQKQIFHCFGCGVGGDVFKFIMLYENVDFGTAVRMLAERAGIRIEWKNDDRESGGLSKDLLFKIHEALAVSYHKALLESPGAAHARAYLKDRELDPSAIEEFMIGYAPDRRDTVIQWGAKKGYPPETLAAAGLIIRAEDGGGYYDRFRNRLMFPIRDELGRVVAFSGRILEKNEKAAKYVNSPETPLFRKGRVLYALDKARRAILDSRQAILCEGQIDVIRCHLAGINTAVAAQGTALTEDHARLFKRYADSVVILLDADAAGQTASLRSAEILLNEGLSVSIATLPKGEDPDSLVRKQGAEALLKVVAAAEPVVVFQVRLLASRDKLETEAGRLRVSRAVLETILHAPTERQREVMLRQAAHGLGLRYETLHHDLRQMEKRGRGVERGSEAVYQPSVHPVEEVTLAEQLILHYEEVVELVRAHVPLDYVTDAACRTIIQVLLNRPADEHWQITSALSDEDEECQQLAIRLQMAPAKGGTEYPPKQAVQDAILRIWKNVFERRRQEVRRKMEKAADGDKERLQIECSQLTLDIKMLQQGWDRALPILEC